MQVFFQLQLCLGVMLDEIKTFLKDEYPCVKNTSLSTVLRVLRIDMGLTRKVMTQRARQARDDQVREYFQQLSCIYSNPEQLVFLDEASRDTRGLYRRYGWSKPGEKAVTRQIFDRGPRRSVIGILDVNGFIDWVHTDGTYNAECFRAAMTQMVLPHLGVWPGPRSILVMDNAPIHRYTWVHDVVRDVGAELIYLPPYSPQLMPIEGAWNLLKMWLARHHSVAEAWIKYPEIILKAGMVCCANSTSVGHTAFAACRYERDGTLGRLVPKRLPTTSLQNIWLLSLAGL